MRRFSGVGRAWARVLVVVLGSVGAAPALADDEDCSFDDCIVVRAKSPDPGFGDLQDFCEFNPINPVCQSLMVSDPCKGNACDPGDSGFEATAQPRAITAANFASQFMKAKSLLEDAKKLANPAKGSSLKDTLLKAFFTTGTPIEFVFKDGLKEMRLKFTFDRLQKKDLTPAEQELAKQLAMAFGCAKLDPLCAMQSQKALMDQFPGVLSAAAMAQMIWDQLFACVNMPSCAGVSPKDFEAVKDAPGDLKGSELGHDLRTIDLTTRAAGNRKIRGAFECPSPGAGPIDIGQCVDPFTAMEQRQRVMSRS
jgi:hypothetical protein